MSGRRCEISGGKLSQMNEVPILFLLPPPEGYVFISLCLFVSRIVQNYSTVIIKKLVERWQLDQGRND